MADRDPPELGSTGGQHVDADEGHLLFDPGAGISVDDEALDAPPPATLSRPVVIGFGILSLVIVTLFGVQFLRSGEEPSDGMETMVIVPAVTSTSGARGESIVPIPADTVRGPVRAVVQVGVRATGTSGSPLRDTLVVFSVESEDWSLVTGEVRTNGDGIAATGLRLPVQPGDATVLAEIPGSTLAPARIVAQAVAGRPDRIMASSGDDQTAEIGQLLPTRVFVTVLDADDNRVPNAQVRFRIESGNGVTAPSQARTDSTGVASALWRLGSVEGEQTLVATTDGLDQEITFTATGTPRPVRGGGDTNRPVEATEVTVARAPYVLGGSHVCMLSRGVLQCRGGNDRGQIEAEGDFGFVALAAGSAHTCGLTGSGLASCWGGNARGQLGDGTRSDRSSPAPVRTEVRFSHLAAGSLHTCGLAGGGVPLCWGGNLSGQLGDGSRNDQILPRTVGGGVTFVQIAAGWNHTCGVSSSGNAFCWGLNSNGQVGDGSRLDRLLPTLVRGGVQDLAAGSSHTCGMADGAVLCWGANSFGQLGDGSVVDRSQPVRVEGLPGPPTALAAGAVHTCALVSGGRAYCWGQNVQGQLGDGTTQNRTAAIAVSGGLSFADIHAGGALTCARTAAGVEYCWGLNQAGQLGDGTRASRSTPTRVGG